MDLYFIVNVDWFFISHRLPIALAAQQKGYRVTVIAHDTGKSEDIKKYGLNFINLPIYRGKTSLINEIKTLFFLWRFFRNTNYGIVHQVGLKIILLGNIAYHLSGSSIKLVNALSGAGTMFTENKKPPFFFKVLLQLFRWSSKRSSFYIFQNKDDLQLFRSITDKVTHYKIIKGSGVDLANFRYSPHIGSSPKIVLFIGRLLREKGIVELIEAAKLLQKDYTGKLKFVILGNIDLDNPSSLTSEYIAQNTIEDYIEWKGHVKEVIGYLEQAYMVVLPSYREGIPKSLIEACALGKAIITTDSVGCREVVQHGNNGLLVPVKAIAELAESILVLIQNEKLVEEMGKNSRVLAEQEFCIQVVVNETLEIYKTLE